METAGKESHWGLGTGCGCHPLGTGWVGWGRCYLGVWVREVLVVEVVEWSHQGSGWNYQQESHCGLGTGWVGWGRCYLGVWVREALVVEVVEWSHQGSGWNYQQESHCGPGTGCGCHPLGTGWVGWGRCYLGVWVREALVVESGSGGMESARVWLELSARKSRNV